MAKRVKNTKNAFWIKESFAEMEGDLEFVQDGIRLLVANIESCYGKKIAPAEAQILLETMATELRKVVDVKVISNAVAADDA